MWCLSSQRRRSTPGMWGTSERSGISRESERVFRLRIEAAHEVCGHLGPRELVDRQALAALRCEGAAWALRDLEHLAALPLPALHLAHRPLKILDAIDKNGQTAFQVLGEQYKGTHIAQLHRGDFRPHFFDAEHQGSAEHVRVIGDDRTRRPARDIQEIKT